jgi:biotin transport system substrate-specific component
MVMTLVETTWPTATPAARNAFLAVAGTILLAISAKVHIPFWPVPLTMQTFVVLVLGMAFGWKLGAATMLLYLAQGAIGLPVFSGTPERGIGLAYMAGPTGGYLAGFVVGAALCGWLAGKGWDRIH